jgi:hypothetical protein
MAGRQRFQAAVPLPSATPTPALSFHSGDNVRTQAALWKWKISTFNILLEGTKDVGHFETAAALYYRDTGLRLLDDMLSVVAVGEGDKGGTKGMIRYFPVLRDVIESDPIDRNGVAFRFIVLLDFDGAGKGAANALTTAGMGFIRNKDVFLLQRLLPRETRDPRDFQRKCDLLNARWLSINCEIEDLISATLLEDFRSTNGGYCRGNPTYLEGAHHYEWNIHAKAPLLRHVREYAIAKDMELTIGVLQSLRYLLGLEPNGAA